MIENWGGYSSRDGDKDQRKWRAFGFAGKTGPLSVWRWWDEGREGGEKAYVIRAPFDLAEYRLVNRRLYFEGRLIAERSSQWRSTWAALAHFYDQVVPSLKGPPQA
jgi:hypothetical protein